MVSPFATKCSIMMEKVEGKTKMRFRIMVIQINAGKLNNPTDPVNQCCAMYVQRIRSMCGIPLTNQIDF